MLEKEFESFLMNEETISSKSKAVQTRLSKARAIEKTLEKSLDTIVSDNTLMYKSLIEINQKLKNHNGAYSNALRKYYIFKNKKAFPQIRDYEGKIQ